IWITMQRPAPRPPPPPPPPKPPEPPPAAANASGASAIARTSTSTAIRIRARGFIRSRRRAPCRSSSVRHLSRHRSDPRRVLSHVLVGVVARAHQRSGGHVLEAQLVRSPLELLELVRVPVADDRQVVLR